MEQSRKGATGGAGALSATAPNAGDRPGPREGANPAATSGSGFQNEADGRAVSLVHRHVFGLKSNVKRNVHFTEETHIVYPAGHNTILYHMDQKTQARTFPGTEGSEGLTCLALSPNRNFLATCEKFQDRAICTIWDVRTYKRRRGTLSYPDCDAREFVCAAFSAENKFLITQGGPPDWMLVLWSWDKARPHGTVKVSNLTGSVIHECSFNPQDSTLVCVIGDGIFKFFRHQEGTFKNIPNQLTKLRETANQNYVCHAWLHDKLIVCSESGEAMLFDNGGEFKMVLPSSPGEPRSLLCVAPTLKGFVVGGDGGMIRIYERADEAKDMYKKVKEVKLDGSLPEGMEGGVGPGAVTSLAVSPSEDTLIIATSTSQLLQLPLSSSDVTRTEESGVDNVLASFHSGPILGLDICIRKPLVVTCGQDKSVRVWNYIERTQELCKFFNEEAFSVAFHPSGFHMIVGFSDKLRLMNLLMDDMRTYKEIPIKACRECRFSHGGQYFAAVNSNTIQVYKTYTCEVVCNLRGHQSKVRSVCWTPDDSRLVSTGADGAAYEYDIIREGNRISHWSQKDTSFSCVIVHTTQESTHSTMYIVGSDKMLNEVTNASHENFIESKLTLGQLALAPTARALFAGVAEPEMPGPLRCYSFGATSWTLDGDNVEYQAHSAPVSRIRITVDDQYLFSTGDDGCLCIFDIVKKTPSKRDKDGALGFAEEILVTRTFLEEKQAALLDLERQVEELTSKIDLQLRHKDSYHKEKMAELQEKYSEEIETERRKFEVLREEKVDTEAEYESSIKKLEETHTQQTQELEQSFQQKMLVEVQRYQKLKQDLEREKEEWDEQHATYKQDHETKIQAMQHDFSRVQRANRDSQDHIIKEKEAAFKQHQETLAQLEADADREIEELKEMYEQRLADEKNEKVRLRGQATIQRKRKDTLTQDKQKKEEAVNKEVDKNKKNQADITKLQKDKESAEKEINERDKTIEDKSQRITSLNKQNQELEKFRFVLDYKIKELKSQIDPKTEKIKMMKETTEAMDDELNDYTSKNKNLALEISQLQMKQRALQEEIKSQRRRLRDDLSLIKRFKLDLSDTMEHVSDNKMLKESVAGLYRKYVQSGVKKLDLDTDMQKEYNRQRDYLEKSVDSLKRKLLKDSEAHAKDNMRIMQENVKLIQEINDLRREINYLKHERYGQELQAFSTSQDALKDASDMSVTKREAEQEIAMQKHTMDQLQRELDQLQATQMPALAARPADATAVPAQSGASGPQEPAEAVPEPPAIAATEETPAAPTSAPETAAGEADTGTEGAGADGEPGGAEEQAVEAAAAAAVGEEEEEVPPPEAAEAEAPGAGEEAEPPAEESPPDAEEPPPEEPPAEGGD